MKMVQSGKVAGKVSLILIIMCGLFLGVTAVTAQAIEDISPDQSFDFVTLLQGQSATLGVSQTTPFGFHTVFVTSIGNSSLSGGISALSTDALGWWTVMVIGARSRTFVDYSFGLVPWGGQKAIVDIPNNGAFGLVLTTVFLTKLPEDGSLSYNVAVGQN